MVASSGAFGAPWARHRLPNRPEEDTIHAEALLRSWYDALARLTPAQ